ncbi:MAG: aminoglycoside phosphotransferase [Lysobacterales bacterium]|jgi:aminoglycoside/choline kinase family phosphotransferase|nr:MAG: aminoglycoside phosphotransferase [Xanthomonadales bacterium]
MSAPNAREAERHAFLARYLRGPFRLAPASEDASFRRYFRVHRDGCSLILMDAPPEREDVRPWLDVAERLRAAGLHAPAVEADDPEAGFVLMEDLGSTLYLARLAPTTADALYGEAMAALRRLQLYADGSGLPPYDEMRLQAELDLLPEWFLARHLGHAVGVEEQELLAEAFRQLIASARAEPQVFVHRDYHSRNLLIVPANGPGIVDFQDAVIGPLSYDLVSLLRDCYIAWAPQAVRRWAEQHRLRLAAEGFPVPDRADFERAFDWMGLQRHLKVLGIFCRLWYRDGKPGYLGDLPRVFAYVEQVASRYREFAPLLALLRRAIDERDLTRPCAP